MNPKQVRLIESPANPQFKLWKKLLDSQGIKKNSLCILSGQKLVEEALRNSSESAVALLGFEPAEPQELHIPSHVEVYQLAKALFAELDVMGTRKPLLLMKVKALKNWEAQKPPAGLQVLVALQDPGNLGAALRLCEAFSVDEVVCLKEAAHPYHPKALRAAAGAVLRLTILNGPSIQELDLPDLLALDASGANLQTHKWSPTGRLLLGEEGRGLPDQLKAKAQLISIPMKKELESLNATSALAIALYDRSTKLKS